VARGGAGPAVLQEGAVGGAAVAARGVAVVAGLPDARGDDAVAAHGRALAGLAGGGAEPAHLEVAVGVAAVAGRGVAVLARLGARDAAVAAEDDALAGLAGVMQTKFRLCSVQSALQPSSPTALPSSQTSPGSISPLPHAKSKVQGSPGGQVQFRLDLADAVAAVAGQGVAVVAGLAEGIDVEVAVAAGGAGGDELAEVRRGSRPGRDPPRSCPGGVDDDGLPAGAEEGTIVPGALAGVVRIGAEHGLLVRRARTASGVAAAPNMRKRTETK
jgi:hypothetical protein